MQAFTKANLKLGMWVKCRNGDLYFTTYEYDSYGLVFANAKKGFNEVDGYEHDLTNEVEFMEYDVMEVFEPMNPCNPLDTSNLKSIWKREDKKKMTVAEVESALGYAVEIISGE